MESTTVCVIVNKTGQALKPSETFIRAHVEGLPGEVLLLIGNPGMRRFGETNGPHLLSRGVHGRGWRWLKRRAGLESLHEQDTRAVTRFLRKHQIEVVLAEYGPTAVSVADACEAAGVPLVAHFHGWDAYQLPRDPEVRRQYRRLFELARAIVVPSRHMRRHLIELGAPKDLVHVNVYGVAQPETLAMPEENDPIFAAVGRFTPKKAPFATLLAFATVVREVPGSTLEMIGDGPLLEPAQLLSTSLGISDRVRFQGATGHDRVFDLMRRARCFVQHSVVAPNGDREGTPVAVLEAMAMGLPVVSTRHTGIAEVVREGETGFLVEEHDVEAMAEAMVRYVRSPELAADHGRKGCETARAWTRKRSLQGLWHIMMMAHGSIGVGSRPQQKWL
jgi:colanic acid/amylovoran biosynthesis glycosyltransferase